MVTLEYYNGSGVELGVVNIDGVETKYRQGYFYGFSVHHMCLAESLLIIREIEREIRRELHIQ